MEGKELSDDDDSLSHDINEDWDHNARYVPPHAGARMISIKAQPPSLQLVIKVAIREVTGDALFVMAYPSAATIANYYHDILKKSAENPNLNILCDRFEKDHQFVAVVSRVVRFSWFILSQT